MITVHRSSATVAGKGKSADMSAHYISIVNMHQYWAAYDSIGHMSNPEHRIMHLTGLENFVQEAGNIRYQYKPSNAIYMYNGDDSV